MWKMLSKKKKQEKKGQNCANKKKQIKRRRHQQRARRSGKKNVEPARKGITKRTQSSSCARSYTREKYCISRILHNSSNNTNKKKHAHTTPNGSHFNQALICLRHEKATSSNDKGNTHRFVFFCLIFVKKAHLGRCVGESARRQNIHWK